MRNNLHVFLYCTRQRSAKRDHSQHRTAALRYRTDRRKRFRHPGAGSSRIESRNLRADARADEAGSQFIGIHRYRPDRFRTQPGKRHPREYAERPGYQYLRKRPVAGRNLRARSARSRTRNRSPYLALSEMPENHGRERLRSTVGTISRLGRIQSRLRTFRPAIGFTGPRIARDFRRTANRLYDLPSGADLPGARLRTDANSTRKRRERAFGGAPPQPDRNRPQFRNREGILPTAVQQKYGRCDRRRTGTRSGSDRPAGRKRHRQYTAYRPINSEPMKLVSLHHVSVSYDKVPVLTDVDLDIWNDDFIGVIGPNGGGKTTLVKAILKAVPYSGEVIYAPEIENRGCRRIGYLPQISEIDKSFPISVREVVLSGLQARKRLLGRYTAEDRQKADELLHTCRIEEIARKPIGTLSGGQIQRTLLCRALISDPKLLILDEPTNFVDNQFEKELYLQLKHFNEKMAIVMVSHDLGTISSYVRSIVCVNRRVHRHDSNIITAEQLHNYNCPIQIVSHGDVPHTVLAKHPNARS